MRSKVNDLGIFAIGIGLIGAAMSIWTYVLAQRDPTIDLSPSVLAVPLGICATFVVLGILTLTLKSRPVIMATMGLLVLGLVADLLLSLNVGKLVISGLIIWLVVKTGNEAMQEVGNTGKHGDSASNPPA